MDFTGERYVPGQAFGEIEVEHMQRYYSVINIIKDKVVLDAACGEGYGSSILSNYAQKVYGIDISEEAVNWANKKYKNEKLEFIQGSIAKLPFPDRSFDVVISYETIEHVEESIQHEFLKEVKRVLKEEGLLIISTPDKLNYSDIPGYRNEYHVKEFYYDEFYNFLEEFFHQIYLFDQGYVNFCVINPSNFSSSDNKTEIIGLKQSIDKERLYVIAVCSEKQLDNLDTMKSLILYRDEPQHSKLYIDYGNGYTDNDVIISRYNLEEEVFIEFKNLEKLSDIKGLRFAPIEGKFCRYKIDSLDSNKSLSITPLNSWKKIGGYDEFLYLNPLYELTGEFSDLSIIRIKFKLKVLNTIEFFSSVNEERENLSKEITRLNKQLVEKDKQLEEKDKQLEEKDKQLREIIKSWRAATLLRKLARLFFKSRS